MEFIVKTGKNSYQNKAHLLCFSLLFLLILANIFYLLTLLDTLFSESISTPLFAGLLFVITSLLIICVIAEYFLTRIILFTRKYYRIKVEEKRKSTFTEKNIVLCADDNNRNLSYVKLRFNNTSDRKAVLEMSLCSSDEELEDNVENNDHTRRFLHSSVVRLSSGDSRLLSNVKSFFLNHNKVPFIEYEYTIEPQDKNKWGYLDATGTIKVTRISFLEYMKLKDRMPVL